ncbi:chemotaxis protein CheA [Aestuariibius sp. HNIBRBA575]|uniref:chemotaxis protein CheA n=1 Tax=Aestuariibius sp. HNIBRBA575 TaxID=3233343 RepID=UPI0034A47D7C
MNELRESFFQECDDLMEVLTDGLEALDDGNHDDETINAMFRAVHSIKGGAGAFDLTALVEFSHALENLLDNMRSGKTDPEPNVTAVLFSSGDHLSDLIELSRQGQSPDPQKGAQIVKELFALCGEDPQQAEEEEAEAAANFEPVAFDFGDDDSGDIDPLAAFSAPAETEIECFEIDFKADPDMFRTGNDPALLFRALADTGTLQVEIDDSAVLSLSEQDWADPVLSWKLTLVPIAGVTEQTLHDVFEFVEGICAYEIKEIAAKSTESIVPEVSTDVLPGPEPTQPEVPKKNEVSTQTKLNETVESAPDESAAKPAQKSQNRASAAARNTIRVELFKVDRLINLVGELVISEAMLRQSMGELEISSHGSIDSAMGQLKQLSGILQESVMTIRAQPVRGLFQRMSRIVRESSKESGKSARLVTNGDATEVDKTVTERLVDPLTHMIRNAVDHGLENPEDRVKAGKPERGTVTLSAAHRSGRVLITLSDDGAGINRKRVRQVAEQKGLVSPEDDLSDSEVDNLLFMPGFSTNDEVSKLSGRGVGMDVVRSEISALGGRVSLQSVAGQGTTLTISLPLTLAVLEGMIVSVAGQTVVVPTTALRETFRTDEASIHQFCASDRVLSMHDGLVPIVDLGAALGFRQPLDDISAQSLLLIEGDSNKRTALVVDEIQGQREVVIKGLEQNYQRIPGISAATILGDGHIALIVDTDQLMDQTQTPNQAVPKLDENAMIGSLHS